MKKYKITLVGDSDYLQNQMLIPNEEEEVTGKKLTGSVKDSEQVVQEYENKIYRDGEFCCIPSKHIEGSLIGAAVDFRIPGKGKKTWKDVFKGLVYCEPKKIHFIPEKKQPDEVYTDITKNPSTRGRNVTKRPMFKNGWKISFTLVSLEDAVGSSVVNQIVVHAGTYKGIGDYRPKFGRFKVESIVELKS